MKIRNAVAAAAFAALGTGCATQQAEVKPQPVVEAPKPPPEATAEERFAKAAQQLSAKDWAGAQAELEKALEKKPDFFAAQYDLAYAKEKQGDLAGAVAAYEKAHELAPENDQVVLNLGKLYREQQNYAKGITLYEAALQKKPYDVDLLNNVSVLYRLQKEYPKAEGALKKLLSRTKDNPEAYKNLALVHYDQGHYRLAQTLCADAAKLDPKDPGVYNNLGMILLKQGDQRGALANFTKAETLDPNFLPAQMNLGAMALNYRDYPTAEKAFAKSVELEPTSVEAHLNHAFALEGMRNKDGSHRVKEAVAEYETVLKLRADQPDAIFGQAAAYAGELKDLPKARDLLSKYLGLAGQLAFKDKASALKQVVEAKIAAGVGSAQNQPKQDVKQAPKANGTGESMLEKVSAEQGGQADPNAQNPANSQGSQPAPEQKPGAGADPKVAPASSTAPAAVQQTSGSAPPPAGGVAK